LRRLELKSRQWHWVRVVEQAAAPAATYERVRHAVQGKRNRDGGGLHCCVRVGYDQEEHDDTAYMRARRGSDTQKGRRTWWLVASAGPARYAARGRERSRLAVSACLGQGGAGPMASAERAGKGESAAAASGWLRGAGWAKRPKARKESGRRFSISSFPFLIFQMHFSNSFL
jgi:hypothetical protein